jgi:N-dimethylarginine dimethylaminohydrolase
MKQILMVPPTNFGVQYEINVHMEGMIGTTDGVEVAKAWTELRHALESVARVTVLPTPPENAPMRCSLLMQASSTRTHLSLLNSSILNVK